jgi:hypothetical protein
MTKKYVLVLAAVLVFGIIAMYGVYSYYSIGKSAEPLSIDKVSTDSNQSSPTTANASTNTTLSDAQEIDNRTNQSTVSLPLEKPPFID